MTSRPDVPSPPPAPEPGVSLRAARDLFAEIAALIDDGELELAGTLDEEDALRDRIAAVDAQLGEAIREAARIADLRARVAEIRDIAQREHDLGRIALSGYVTLLTRALEAAPIRADVTCPTNPQNGERR